MISELNRLHKIVATRSSETVGGKSSDVNNLLFVAVGAIFAAARAFVRNPIPTLMVLMSIASRVNAYQPRECLYSSPVPNADRGLALDAMEEANLWLFNNVSPGHRPAVVLTQYSNSSLPFTQADVAEWGGALCGRDVSSAEKELGGFGGIYKAMKDVAGDFAPQFESAVSNLDVEAIAQAIANGRNVSIITEMPSSFPTPSPTPMPVVISISPTASPTETPSQAPTAYPTQTPSQAPTNSPAPSQQPTPAPTVFEVSIDGEYFCTVAGKQLKQMGCRDADFQMLYDKFFATCGGLYSFTNDCAVDVYPAVTFEATQSQVKVRTQEQSRTPLYFSKDGEIEKTAQQAVQVKVSPLEARVHENRTWIDGTAGVVGLVIGLAIAAAAAKSKASLENRRLTALANASYALMPQDEDVSAAGYKLIGQDDGKVFTGNPTKGFKEDRFAKANHVIPTLIHDGCAARDQIEFEKTLSDLTDIVIGKMDWTGANGSHKDGAARAVVIGLLSKIHQLLNLARDGVMGEEDRCATRDPRNFKYPIALPETLPAGVLSDKDGWSQNDTILSILEHAVNQVERTGWKDWATSFGQKPAYEVSKADEYLKKRLDFTPGIRPIDLEEVGLHVGEPLDGLQAV